MTDTHPIYHRPIIYCGKCHRPLVFPLKREIIAEDIAAGRAVLGECNTCAVAVQVPAEMFSPSTHTHVGTTKARPWPTPQAVLTAGQLQALKPE